MCLSWAATAMVGSCRVAGPGCAWPCEHLRAVGTCWGLLVVPSPCVGVRPTAPGKRPSASCTLPPQPPGDASAILCFLEGNRELQKDTPCWPGLGVSRLEGQGSWLGKGEGIFRKTLGQQPEGQSATRLALEASLVGGGFPVPGVRPRSRGLAASFCSGRQAGPAEALS